MPTFISEAEALLQSGTVPNQLVTNHNRAQSLLKRVREAIGQREMTLKKLSKDWETYEEKKSVLSNAIESTKNLNDVKGRNKNESAENILEEKLVRFYQILMSLNLGV